MKKQTTISLALVPAALSLAFAFAVASPAEAGDRFERHHNGQRHRGDRVGHKRDRFEQRRDIARDRVYERESRRLRKHGNHDAYNRRLDRFERRDALKRDRFYKRQARKQARQNRRLHRRHDRFDRRHDRFDRRYDRRHDRFDRRYDRRDRRQTRRFNNHYHGNRFFGDRSVFNRVYRPLGYIFSGFYDDCY